MSIADNISRIRAAIPEGVTLVAVSKFHPVEALMEAYRAGVRDFGESRVQELAQKVPLMPADVRWHFIGHLQTNKARQLVSLCHIVQSVDSVRLLRLLDAEAVRAGVRLQVLLQAHVAREETKFGMTPEEMLAEITPELMDSLQAVEVAGLMGMASNTDDEQRIEDDFERLHRLFLDLRAGVMAQYPAFSQLSMGMSHDYPLALRHGATAIRVGTDIFGEREY